ncbi:hypothetical protein OAT67_06140 [Bacteriovoracaceae bacterium]|nr:hypothetical protein [Bacteriovoracaceae bacterium]
MSIKNSSKKNPLFVVTNNGQDVEEATNMLDALIKRLGLEPAIEIFEQILEFLLSQVKSYAAFEQAKKYVDDLVDLLEKILKMIDPVLAFSVISR